MLKVTLPLGGSVESESELMSYMEKRGRWRVISNTWNCVLQRDRKQMRRLDLTEVKGQHMVNTLVSPGPASNEGFDVQVHWYVFGWDDGDSNTP